MDIRMPGMDGRKATRWIKEQAQTQGRETKILALTASSFEEEREKILQAGCDDFLRKPFQEGPLLEMMGMHLGLRLVYADDFREEKPPDEPLEDLERRIAAIAGKSKGS